LSLKWDPITRTKPALPDADEWVEVKDKRDQLKR
jgi:ferredoxin